jgi:hypothetical protein
VRAAAQAQQLKRGPRPGSAAPGTPPHQAAAPASAALGDGWRRCSARRQQQPARRQSPGAGRAGSPAAGMIMGAIIMPGAARGSAPSRAGSPPRPRPLQGGGSVCAAGDMRAEAPTPLSVRCSRRKPPPTRPACQLHKRWCCCCSSISRDCMQYYVPHIYTDTPQMHWYRSPADGGGPHGRHHPLLLLLLPPLLLALEGPANPGGRNTRPCAVRRPANAPVARCAALAFLRDALATRGLAFP